MQSWHTTYLGLKDLPRELSAFEIQAFFTYSRAEREVIDGRHGATHKLGLALHIGFLRLSGRSFTAVRVVPVSLWTHLGKELGVRAPELASLKALYGRRSTLFEHQQLAQQTLGFRGAHQNRAFVQVLRDEAARLPAELRVFAAIFTRICSAANKAEAEKRMAGNDCSSRERTHNRQTSTDWNQSFPAIGLVVMCDRRLVEFVPRKPD